MEVNDGVRKVVKFCDEYIITPSLFQCTWATPKLKRNALVAETGRVSWSKQIKKRVMNIWFFSFLTEHVTLPGLPICPKAPTNRSRKFILFVPFSNVK
jgi:hypothetical protein